MNTPVLILIGTLSFLMIVAFAKPLQGIFQFLIRAILGGIGIYACQSFGLGLGLAINLVTLSTVGVLGLPGFLGLLALITFL